MPREKLSGRSEGNKRFGPGRSRLQQIAGARGHSLNNLWYHYSPRLHRDVVLKGDLAIDHFCWIEGDERVARYELDVEITAQVDGVSQRVCCDALVEFRDGSPPESRELRHENPRSLIDEQSPLNKAALATGHRYLCVTRSMLASHAIHIKNWRCALASLAAARDLFVLESACKEIVEIVSRERRCSIGALLAQLNPALRPEYLAALFRCLQDARLTSDLSSAPLCDDSLVFGLGVSRG